MDIRFDVNKIFLVTENGDRIEIYNALKEFAPGENEYIPRLTAYDLIAKIISENQSVSFEIDKARDEKEETVSSLKKRIKHCKNPIERKKLQQELDFQRIEKRLKKRG